MIDTLSAADDYRTKARRLREIAAQRETSQLVREALTMAAAEYERLAERAVRGDFQPN